jgi:hypothetical protein
MKTEAREAAAIIDRLDPATRLDQLEALPRRWPMPASAAPS